MKKVYTKPELDTKGYAQFENVFTQCTKGNSKKAECYMVPGWPPVGNHYAAYGGNHSIS